MLCLLRRVVQVPSCCRTVPVRAVTDDRCHRRRGAVPCRARTDGPPASSSSPSSTSDLAVLMHARALQSTDQLLVSPRAVRIYQQPCFNPHRPAIQMLIVSGQRGQYWSRTSVAVAVVVALRDADGPVVAAASRRRHRRRGCQRRRRCRCRGRHAVPRGSGPSRNYRAAGRTRCWGHRVVEDHVAQTSTQSADCRRRSRSRQRKASCSC